MDKPNFKDKMKHSLTGSKKMLIGIGIVVVGALAVSYLTTPEPEVSNSNLSAPPVGNPTVQGGNQISPAYNEALNQADTQRIETARETGGSAIPTIRANPSDQILPVIELDPEPEPAPEVNLPVVQPPVIVQQPVVPTVPIVQPPAPMRNADETRQLREFMMSSRRPIPVAEVLRFSTSDLEQQQQAQSAPAVPPTAPSAAQAPASAVTLPLAGTILYAEMISRANSDTPGPILARVLQGEYAGATLIGSFQTARNALILSFDRMTVTTTRDGREINETVPISTVAVDTSHIGTGLATSVDRHMFQKLAIGFTSSFAQGFGEALARNGTSRVVTESGTTFETTSDLSTDQQLLSAGGRAVSSAGDILMEEFGRRPTTVIVESGTPIGILFL